MSTRPLNDEEVQRLPELRTSAQKYNRFGKPQQKEEDYALDYAIDTSAVARAFPDFTQGSSSFEPDSPSIEIGRGAKKSNGGTIGKLARSEEYSSNAQLDLNEDSFDSSKPMSIGGGYQLMYTPPIRSRQTSKKTEIEAHGQLRHDAQPRRASGLRKEVVDPSLPLAKTKDYGSGESRKASGESQRTVASMQARVRDENDSPHMSEEKRPSVGLTARKTRFGNVNSQQTGTHDPLPTRFSTAQTLMKSVAPKKQQNPRTVPSTNPGTQQSFVLPPMPNMSELISGVFDNGTPVFSRDGKPSRFVAALQRSTVNGVNLADVDEIPMRVDEQAIFLNLQLLQDKVKELEKINAALSDEMCDLERKNRILEGEKEFRQRTSRRDSALGTSESEGANDVGGGQRRLLVEKSRKFVRNALWRRETNQIQGWSRLSAHCKPRLTR